MVSHVNLVSPMPQVCSPHQSMLLEVSCWLESNRVAPEISDSQSACDSNFLRLPDHGRRDFKPKNTTPKPSPQWASQKNWIKYLKIHKPRGQDTSFSTQTPFQHTNSVDFAPDGRVNDRARSQWSWQHLGLPDATRRHVESAMRGKKTGMYTAADPPCCCQKPSCTILASAMSHPNGFHDSSDQKVGVNLKYLDHWY